MLNIIGTGLKSFLDIPYSCIEILKTSKFVFLEAYTCIIDIESQNSILELEKLINKRILPLQRYIIESTTKLLDLCIENNISLLVVGTPLFATTHLDILERCKELNIKTNIINNCSIQNVIGCVGLYSYNFGRTISMPFFSEGFKPISIYDYLKKNMEINLHTLMLLDIQMENKLNSNEIDYYTSQINLEFENKQTLNSLFFNNNKFMTANIAIKQLLILENLTKYKLLNNESKIFVICRFSTNSQNIIFDSIKNLKNIDFGLPMHSIIIPANIDKVESSLINKLFKN